MRQLILALAVLCAACQQQGPYADPVQSAKISQLEARISAIEEDSSLVRKQLDAARAELVVLRFSSPIRPALIDPSDGDGYSSMGTSIGALLVTFQSIEPIGDGSRVTILVGNPHAATLNGLNLNVAYGNRQGDQPEQAWLDGLKHTKKEAIQTFPSNSWTRVSFSLPGLKPDEVGHIRIHGEVGRLSLTLN